jgi:lysozyme
MKAKGWMLGAGGIFALGLGLWSAFLHGIWVPNGPNPRAFPTMGIDVSNHQGEIDWDRVAKAGVKFVYIKSTEGSSFSDKRFATNWAESERVGITRGAYHYFTFRSSGEAQARHMIKTVPRDPKALPPAIDLEFDGNSALRPTVAEFTQEFGDFMRIMEDHYGTVPVVYTMDTFHDVYLRDVRIERLWLRDVFFKPKDLRGKPFVIWQYSDRGQIDGISGPVDMNVLGRGVTLDSLLVGEKD